MNQNLENAELNARFEYLLDAYLENTATEAEKAELRRLVENGYAEKFRSRIDQDMLADLGTADQDTEIREEILLNIFDRTPLPAVAPKRAKARWYYAAAAAILLFGAISLIVYTTGDHSSIVNRKSSISQSPVIKATVYRDRQYIVLPDSSTVLLNDNSTLSYERDFNGALREVTLTGEAFFDIAHNPGKPFRVHTGDVVTTVLGTAFNVNANSDVVRVNVARGKVQVGDGTKIYGLLTPDQQITVDTKTLNFKQVETKAATAAGWKRDFLILDNISMEAAALLISDRFEARIVFENESLKRCKLSATFLHGESLTQVLNVVTGVAEVAYAQRADGTILIKGAGCE